MSLSQAAKRNKTLCFGKHIRPGIVGKNRERWRSWWPFTAMDRSTPGQGTKIPRGMDQLRPSITTAEPVCSGARLPQLGTACCNGRLPHDATTTRRSQINVERKKERKKMLLKKKDTSECVLLVFLHWGVECVVEPFEIASIQPT